VTDQQMKSRPILCLDFDGVIHAYSRGWQGGEIYDDVTPGFFEWAEEAQKHFKLVIYSSRSKSSDGIAAMQAWLVAQRAKWREHGGESSGAVLEFEFANEKPPAWLTIDDRAIKFEGRWDWIRAEVLQDFRPWNAR